MVQASWNPDHHPDCGKCSDRAETFHHIFACTNQDASTAYEKAKTALITAMRKANTAPLINSAIVTLVEEYRKGYEITLKHNPFHTQDQHELASAVMTYQRQMGLNFFNVGISPHSGK